MNPDDFISRWRRSSGAELASSQSFLKELCQLLGVPEPEPTQADESQNVDVFEKAISLNNGDGTEASAQRFKSVKANDVEELLDTLASIGQVRLWPDRRYAI
jgi:hypothetical protein